jgi:hypothetical protein
MVILKGEFSIKIDLATKIIEIYLKHMYIKIILILIVKKLKTKNLCAELN